MSSSRVVVGRDKSTHSRVVISALEIVERGLSLLGLSVRHIYAQSVPTRNREDFVWVSLRQSGSLNILNFQQSITQTLHRYLEIKSHPHFRYVKYSPHPEIDCWQLLGHLTVQKAHTTKMRLRLYAMPENSPE